MTRSAVKKVKQVFVSPSGEPVKAGGIDKFVRDIVRYQRGESPVGDKLVTVYDSADPLGGTVLAASAASPICGKCDLFNNCAKTPFMEFWGSETPLVTVVFENVSPKEDQLGVIGTSGANFRIREHIENIGKEIGVSLSDIRWCAVTRCANLTKKLVNFKDKGKNWCRNYLVQDLALHPPKLIMPVGTGALGALSHKSNANDWANRLLTYRGWPDDWLTNPDYVLPRPDPANPEATIVGHPIFGPPPGREAYIPMFPVMSPRIVLSQQNPYVTARWVASIRRALDYAKSGAVALSYTRPWYEFTDDPKRIEAVLRELKALPPSTLCYDLETTGVRPWADDAAIVIIVMRWVDPGTGKPRSLGFPWDYAGLDFHNKVRDAIPRLAPLVLAVLYRHRLTGHNLTFDVLYTFANMPKADLDKLCDAMAMDTWHMIYTLRQRPGTLGLEAITYDYCPDLAGYEEDMTLLIDLHYETMHPAGNKGGPPGHYANCPRDKWDTHLIPYVMGDVETCARAMEKAQVQLGKAREYSIPLAHPNKRGSFRLFKAPRRDWVYRNIMAPAAAVLAKIMGRGMEIDPVELTRLEERYPILIREARDTLRHADPRIVEWCDHQANQDPSFELDLESKSQLKTILFDILQLPVNRLTKAGRKMYGEDESAYAGIPREKLMEYAALDKFTLNKMAVSHEQVRPLQEYRKTYKLYTTYIRPLRNITTEGIDKKERSGDQHLCYDSRIHASFLLTGTRAGRLSCKAPNLQQLPREGDVKSMFVSRFTQQGRKGCLYQGDLSQIELRLLAAGCGDPTMVKAYFDKTDLHTLTTSRIFKVPYEHFAKEHFEWLQKQGKDKEAKDLNQKRQIGKCVDPSTLISVNGRITRIGSLHAGRKEDTYYPVKDAFVQTPTGFQPVKSFYCNGVKDAVIVRAAHGVIKCSLTHRFQLADGSLVQAHALKPGMVLKDSVALAAGKRVPVYDGSGDDDFDEELAYTSGVYSASILSSDPHRSVPFPFEVVPDGLFNAHRDAKLSFVAGVLDTGGQVQKDGSTRIRCRSWRFAQDFMTLCGTLKAMCTLAAPVSRPGRPAGFIVCVPTSTHAQIVSKLRRQPKKDSINKAEFKCAKRGPNVVHTVSTCPASVLVDISLDDPHLYLPEGLVTHQTVNFLTGYGGGAFGLQTTLAARSVYLPIEECEKIIDSFFDTYPSLKRHLQYYKAFIQETCVAVSILGRVRIFEEVQSADREAISKALRAGCNHLIQSTASDMMLVALVAIEDLMREAELESVLVSTVHDSLLIDALQDELPQIHEIVTAVLNNFDKVLPAYFGDDYDTSWMIVPFAGDCEVGMNYLDSKSVPKSNVDWHELLYPKAKK